MIKFIIQTAIAVIIVLIVAFLVAAGLSTIAKAEECVTLEYVGKMLSDTFGETITNVEVRGGLVAAYFANSKTGTYTAIIIEPNTDCILNLDYGEEG